MPDNSEAGPFNDLDPLEVGGVHRAARHGRGADPDIIIKRVDLVAGKAAHREDRRRARRIAAGHADGGLCNVGGRPETAILDHLLVDDLDRRRRLPRGDAESRPDFGYDIGVERCLRRSAAVGHGGHDDGGLRTRTTGNPRGGSGFAAFPDWRDVPALAVAAKRRPGPDYRFCFRLARPSAPYPDPSIPKRGRPEDPAARRMCANSA